MRKSGSVRDSSPIRCARRGFGRRGGAEEGNGGSCDGFPVEEAAADVDVEEEHPKEVAFVAGSGGEVFEDRGRELMNVMNEGGAARGGSWVKAVGPPRRTT